MPFEIKTIARRIFTAEVLKGMFSALLLVALVWLLRTDWHLSSQRVAARHLRLRFYFASRYMLPKGTLIRSTHLQPHLGRADDTAGFAFDRNEITSRYTQRELQPGLPLLESDTSEFSDSDPPSGGALISVEVPTDHIYSIRPGIAVGFVRQQSANADKPEVFPRVTEPCARKHHFPVVREITPSQRDPKSTTLTVAIPFCCKELVAILSSGTWRPVILADNYYFSK